MQEKIYHILNRASSYENRFLKYSSQKKEREGNRERKRKEGSKKRRKGETKEEMREGGEERRREGSRGERREEERMGEETDTILPMEARNVRERAGREGQSVVTRAIFLCVWNIILSSPYLSPPQVQRENFQPQTVDPE